MQHTLFMVEVVGQWAEYFKDLVNPTSMISTGEAERGDLWSGSPISGAEVTKVVKKLLGGNTVGG